MTDGTVGVKQATSPDRLIDNELDVSSALTSLLIASGSNGQALPQSTINVQTDPTASGYPTTGIIGITINGTVTFVSYTGLTSSSFTGCTGGSGTLATGQTVQVGVYRQRVTSDVTDRTTRKVGRVTNPYSAGGQYDDASGNRNYATPTGGSLPRLQLGPWEDQAWQDAVNFDGLDRGVTALNQGLDGGALGVGGAGGTTAFTVELKFNKTRTGVVEVLCGTHDDSQLNVELFLDASNQLNGRVTNASNATVTITSGAVALGRHDAALTWDAATLRLYLDGTLIGAGTSVAGLQVYNGTTHFTIGRSGTTAGNGNPLKGQLNEVRLSNSARYTGSSYVPSSTKFIPDANTVALWDLDYAYDGIQTNSRDSYGSVDYFGGAQNSNAGTVTFTAVNGPCHMVGVRIDDGSLNFNVAWATTDGSTPSSTNGEPLDDGIFLWIPVKTNTVKVFSATTGKPIHVVGRRY